MPFLGTELTDASTEEQGLVEHFVPQSSVRRKKRRRGREQAVTREIASEIREGDSSGQRAHG